MSNVYGRNNPKGNPIWRTIIALILFCVMSLEGSAVTAAENVRRLPLKEYIDKMKAGWLGQMVGVGWGGPTEFRWCNVIMPADKMPKFSEGFANDSFGQDDIYVEMTFIRSMEEYGIDVSTRQAGIDFANSEYAVDCANKVGRRNLCAGIAPPDSGHPKFSKRPNDIDYQIEADYSGLINPGMPNMAIMMGEKFGLMMNYSDGMYAGQFIGGMYCEAFFEKDIVKIIEAGLKCIPAESQYAEMVRDMLAWFKADPDNWEKTWRLCTEKYHRNPEYQKCSNGTIDCKINGAYVLMGLLYGKGDVDQTIIISTRCGMDSDCNPSSAAGVLFTTIGFSEVPERYSKGLKEDVKFSHTDYDFPLLLRVCEKLCRQAVEKSGGRIEKDANGEEVLVIPVIKLKPSKLELSWEPGPIANSKFTDEEMARIKAGCAPEMLQGDFDEFAPGWKISTCGPFMDPGPRKDLRGKSNIFVTHPWDEETPCVLSKTIEVPAGKKTTLKFAVSHYYDWTLVVKGNGKELLTKEIEEKTCPNGWAEITVDLFPFAGKSVELELENKAGGQNRWNCEVGYWADLKVISE